MQESSFVRCKHCGKIIYNNNKGKIEIKNGKQYITVECKGKKTITIKCDRCEVESHYIIGDET